ncbi:MAG TPA: outer membrane lipoprotein carrier protein LolA [Terriglobia bacterium]|jgi:outer membrane lipoprotein-sorting protein
MRPKVLSLLCILWLLPVLNAETTLDQVFAKMDDTAKSFHSIECSLEQTKITVLVDDKDVKSGKLYYSRAGKEPRLKVEISKPGEQKLLIDKGKFQLYTPSIKQLQEGSLGSHASAVDQLMAVGFGQSSSDLKKNFKVTMAGEEVIDGKKTAILDLAPNAPMAVVKTLRMWIDEQKGIALQVKVTESGGDYTIYKYTNIKVNSTLPDDAFELKMPKDVHVNKL